MDRCVYHLAIFLDPKANADGKEKICLGYDTSLSVDGLTYQNLQGKYFCFTIAMTISVFIYY